jgi:hypothetical protein
MLLEDGNSVVRDVLKIPEHSKRWPLSIGECQINGAKVSESIVAILDNYEATYEDAVKVEKGSGPSTQ